MYEVIVNPAARNGQAKEIGQEAERYLKEKQVDFIIRYTEYPGHATELARDAASRGVETVIAMGGDGTVCETAAGLVHTNTSLGIVPAGTGNDFIKTIGTPRQWKEALDFILTHPARPVNTGEVNDRFFMNVCGGGFDVLTLTYALEAKKHVKGIWPYLYGVLRAIRTFQPFRMHIEVDHGQGLHDLFHRQWTLHRRRYPHCLHGGCGGWPAGRARGGCGASLEDPVLSALADERKSV